MRLLKIIALFLCASTLPGIATVHAGPMAPGIDPPREERPVAAGAPLLSIRRSLSPTSEWTLHRSADGLHPDGTEQAMLWLQNRARQDPAREGVWLATSTEPDIANGRSYFGVDTAKLRSEFAGYTARPPAVFDARLYAAARTHSEDLITRDAQDHSGQFQRVRDAGFAYTQLRGNVFSYARNPLYAHAAFNIDWGNAPDGMQTSRGHRKAIMSIDGDYTNFGLAAVPDDNSGTSVGPLVMTGNFAKANTGVSDHFNRFLVGTVWQDSNDNGRFDPGEGFSGVTVTPDKGSYFSRTSPGGGYAIPITQAGDYRVTFSGGGIGADYATSVSVGEVSLLLDYALHLHSSFCTSEAAELEEIIFVRGASVVCSAGISITTRNSVVVPPEADVTFRSPIIRLNPGFQVLPGGLFQAITGP